MMPLIGPLFWLGVIGVLATLAFWVFHSYFERRGWFESPATWIRQEQPHFGTVTRGFLVDEQTGELRATVAVGGELWTAVCDESSLREQIQVGDKVVVERSDGLRLSVKGRYRAG